MKHYDRYSPRQQKWLRSLDRIIIWEIKYLLPGALMLYGLVSVIRWVIHQ